MAGPCPELALRKEAQSICAIASSSSWRGDFCTCGGAGGGGGGTCGTAAEAVERCPGRAGNCSVQGSVGNGQPGHPVVEALPGGADGAAEGAAAATGFSSRGLRASTQAAARLLPSACWPALMTLSSCP